LESEDGYEDADLGQAMARVDAGIQGDESEQWDLYPRDDDQ
jgi:hypothetical protein